MLKKIELNHEEAIMIPSAIKFTEWVANKLSHLPVEAQKALDIRNALLQFPSIDTQIHGWCDYSLDSLVHEQWDGEGKEPKTVSYMYFVDLMSDHLMLGRNSIFTPMDKWYTNDEEFRDPPEYRNSLPDYELFINFNRESTPPPFDIWTEAQVREFAEIFVSPDQIDMSDGFVIGYSAS